MNWWWFNIMCVTSYRHKIEMTCNCYLDEYAKGFVDRIYWPRSYVVAFKLVMLVLVGGI